jgi:glycosyltransferase involved in cell wall biosynthesis
MKQKLIRITTVPVSLEKLLENQLTFMSGFFEVTAIAADKKRLEQFGLDNKVKTKYIELTRKITPIQDIKTLWQLYKFLKKEQPDIVHSHTPKAGIIGMLAAKLAGVPSRLHTVAGLPLLETTGVKRKILNFVERLTYSSATKVYPNSYGLEKIILEHRFAKKEKLKVIANGSSNGIDTNYFKPTIYSERDKITLRNSLNISKNDFVFTFVGRLVGDKGINELAFVFNQLSKKNVNIKLLLVGNEEPELDPLLPETQKTIQNHSHIITTGWVDDVRQYLAISNALVFPSYREGFPNVVLQAGAMKLPAIVSNINGCNEIIIDNFNGLIVPAKDYKNLFNAMNELLEDNQLLTKLANNARQNIVAKYEQKNVWQALLNEYKNKGV